ncbi:MAG TPA: glycerophosphodiester phosphodiesterase [Gemmatimonadaceae bacterium]|nr:glycerophosphodiester phosphodiesterase [Gemmatimonadaceae bacterium]
MRIERIAHRGAKREFHENTVPAFQRAYELGADAVELDVHATADGVVVVHHDPDVWSGRHTVDIASAGWAELSTLELAGGASIPRLIDVLAITPAGRTVYVEIKGSGIEQLVADAIRSADARCAVHSFDHGAIGVMREIAPEIPRGVLFERDAADIPSVMARVGARDVWPQWKLVDSALVGAVHAAGGRLLVWTVNDGGVATRLEKAGVDGLCGDDIRVFSRPPA